MPSATAQAAGTGLPYVDLSAQLLTKEDLAKHSNAELYQIASLLRAAADMLAYNPFAGLLEDISGMVASAACAVAEVAAASKPTDPNEANWRGWIIAGHAAFVSDTLADIAAAAAQAAVVERDLHR